MVIFLVPNLYICFVCAHIPDWFSNLWNILESTGSDNSALLVLREVNGENFAARFRLKLLYARKRDRDFF